tara:strand:- start:570 stop:959 length:390 start_codon:yes stop_codon:yes gene_type:complete
MININNIERVENIQKISSNIIIEAEQDKKELEEKKIEKRKEMKIKANKMSKLKSQIDNLSKSEYIEIFKIIKMNSEKFSQNKNGVMFDLMKFSDKAINEINNFITYIENNNLLVENDEETRNVFRTLIN